MEIYLVDSNSGRRQSLGIAANLDAALEVALQYVPSLELLGDNGIVAHDPDTKQTWTYFKDEGVAEWVKCEGGLADFGNKISSDDK